MRKMLIFLCFILILFVPSCSFVEKVYVEPEMEEETVSLPEEKKEEQTYEIIFPDLDENYVYSPINIVSEKEFDFGEYLPVFSFDIDVSITPIQSSYGIFLPDTEDIEKAVNNYFLLENEKEDVTDLYAYDSSVLIRESTRNEYNKEKNFFDNSLLIQKGLTLENGKQYGCCISDSQKMSRFVITAGSEQTIHINQVLQGNKLIVTAICGVSSGDGNGRSATYLYDFENGTVTHLADEATHPVLSPDGKYLAYSSSYIDENGLVRSRGFYLLNIEKDETVYINYPYHKGSKFRIENFIKTEDYFDAVDDTGKKAVLDEKTEAFFGTYVFMKEVNKDTIELKIDIPEDYSERPFDPSELVPFEEFDFGEYVPFVSFVNGRYTASDDIVEYAIISSKTKEMKEARELYQDFNNKFLIKSPVCNYELFGYKVLDTPFIVDYFYNSKITSISPEVDKVTRRRFEIKEEKKYQTAYLGHDDYNVINDVVNIADKTVETSEVSYSGVRKEYEFPFGDAYEHIYGDELVATSKGFIYIYDIPTKKVKYKIEVPYTEVSLDGKWIGNHRIKFYDYIDSRYLVLEIEKWGQMSKDDKYNSIFITYLYDLETGDFSEIGRYAGYLMLSPDMKYAAYVSPMGYDYGGDIHYNNLEAMECGYYIRNLETGETTYLADEYFWHEVRGFVREETIYEIINSDEYYVDESIQQRVDYTFSEKDTDTVTQSLELTDDVPTVKISGNIVPHESFTFGEYVPFVKFLTNKSSSQEYSLYNRAFLSSVTSNVEEGEALYSKLDSLYKTSSGDDKYFEESRVTYVSQDGKRVGVFSFVQGDGKNKDSIYKLYEGNELLLSDLQKNARLWSESGMYQEQNTEEGFSGFDICYPTEECGNIVGNYSNNDYKLYYGKNGDKLIVFSGESKKMLYEVLLPCFEEGELTYNSYVKNFSGGKFVLLSVPYKIDGQISSKTVLFNLETGDKKIIEGLGNYPEISPDGKFILSVADGYGGDNEDAPMGFYICNVEKGETVYYQENCLGNTKYSQRGNYINWVNEENLLKTINGQ